MKEKYSDELAWWQKALGIWRINKGSVDFKWGYFAPDFGFTLIFNRGGYFDSRCSITICLIWGTLNIRLPFKTQLAEGCDLPRYGVQIHGNTFWLHYGGKYDESCGQVTGKSYSAWDLPFFSWEGCVHEVRDEDLSWRIAPKFEDRDGTYKESYPYIYILRSGKVQEVIATVNAERRTWHRKWFPFLKQVRQSIDVSFDSEVGEGTGSWKGGTVGCGYDMLPHETMKECLYRMQDERKFSR